MPPKKKSKSNIVYLNRQFTKPEREQFKKWLATDVALEKLLLVPADGGCKTSIGYDDYNNCYQATITRPSDDPKEPIMVLVSRASSPLAALYAVLYKHVVLFDSGWDFDEFPRNQLDDE